MRTLFITLAVATILIVGCLAFGVIGFHYPKVIQNEPLHNPQKVARIIGSDVVMQNGAVVRIDNMDASEISNKLSQSTFEVELDRGTNGEPVAVWARQKGWVCGTPWAQSIVIPLVEDTVYKIEGLLSQGAGMSGRTRSPNRFTQFSLAVHFPFALDFAHHSNESIFDGDGRWLKGTGRALGGISKLR